MNDFGDPASSSALGGALRAQALQLAALAAELSTAAEQLTRRGHPDPTAAERELLTSTARQLDAVGAALQAWSGTVMDGSARMRDLHDEATRWGLVIDGRTVLAASGPSRVDPAARGTHQVRLQELVGRVTAMVGRDLGRVGRDVAATGPTLARLSAQARSGH